MVEVTQEVREAAADILDEISSLTGDDGTGQVADLIRDGEYDEHHAVQRCAAHRQAAFKAGRASVLAELESPTEAMVTISEPDMSGDFEGDVWFGHPEKRTLGTHIWRAGTWHRLPSEVDAVISLLAKARKQRNAAIEGLVLAVSALERGTHQDFQDETRQEITAMIGAYKEAL